MTRAGAGLAALIASLAIAMPAVASTRQPRPAAAAFEVPAPSVPFRDVVLDLPSRSVARATASDAGARYPVNDAAGRTVFIRLSDSCATFCNSTDRDPQTIANFLGTLAHREEIGRLTVDLVTPLEITSRCGTGALACYYSGQQLMVINGNDSTAPDGATRAFVIAHEYGHHVANNRRNPPFEPTIDFGPKYWTTYERVCEGVEAGVYFPGDQDEHYYENPGEAYAEASAFNRFPDAPVQWAWIPSLKPDANAFSAIDRDAENPWTHRVRVKRRGHLPLNNGKNSVAKKFKTPLDGNLTMKLRGPPGADLDLILRDNRGHTLGSSKGPGSQEKILFTICGQANVRGVVKRTGPDGGRFRLTAIRP